MKNLENEKKIILGITIVWVIASLVGGILFLKKFYSIGMMNQWCSVVDKWEQIVWAVIAYLLAVIVIYNIARFAVKAVLYNDRERKIILYALPALILLLGAFCQILHRYIWSLIIWVMKEIYGMQQSDCIHTFLYIHRSYI